MKTVLLSIVSLFNGLLLQAQGIYNMWGITNSGGSEGLGVIYKTDGAGNHFQVQHNFRMTAPGAQPQFTQLVDYQDKFYGVTLTGGTLAGGNLFEWDPVTNIFTSKVNFTGPNGYHPYGSLTLVNNKFYGMTAEGGLNNAGIIFEWDPATNAFTKKIDLADSSGSHPQGDLLYYNGYLYGSTPEGGAYSAGVLFKWNPATNVYQNILNFDMSNGYLTGGNLVTLNNKIYGWTQGVYGAIFELNPQNDLYTRVFEFNEYTGLAPSPTNNIITDSGKIYGFHDNAIFEWNPLNGSFLNRVTLNESGEHYCKLEKANGKFYGTLDSPGYNYWGSLFEWDPTTVTIQKLFDFNLYNYSGIHPTNPLAFKNGILYGMTAAGGANGWDEFLQGLGVIYQWDIASSTYTKRLDLEGGVTNKGTAGLCYLKGKLYGRTTSSNGGGVIFEYDPQTNTYGDKTRFEGGFSYSPVGNMVAFQNKLYGLCGGGGAKGFGGEIFEYDPASNLYKDSRTFGSPDRYGYSPVGNFTLYNNVFYGSNSMGGVNEDGTAARMGVFFSFNPVSGVYQGVTGMQPPEVPLPITGLTLFKNKLYGGASIEVDNYQNQYILFEWNPADNSYTRKIELTEANGNAPGDMTVFNNKLYGAARLGGVANTGALFEWDPIANVYTKKMDFTGANGGWPYGGMVLNNGKLYGTTRSGGDAGAGVLFEWNPLTNVYTKKKDFGGTDGAVPSGSLTQVPAPVAAGVGGQCISLGPVVIDNSNNKQWLAITDEDGNAVAEINANGNNLGTVSAALFVNSGEIRKAADNQPCLDRNITLSPQVQPTQPVSIRLYITTDEYNRLKAAANQWAAGAISNTGDLRIYSTGAACAATVGVLNNAATASAQAWENDLVLSATVTQLGSFFIAGKAACTAPVISHLSANPAVLWPPNHQMKNVIVNYKVIATCTPVSVWLTVSCNEKSRTADWVIVNDHMVQLRAERAGNGSGRVYTITLHATDAAGNTSTQSTRVSVPHSIGCIKSKYDAGLDENTDFAIGCSVVPNPSHNYFTLQVQNSNSKTIEVMLSDLTGRLISKWTAADGTSRFGDQLLPGMYLLTLKQGEQQVLLKLVKQ